MLSTLESHINHTVSVTIADGNRITIDDLVDLYRDFAKTPIPISGRLSVGDNEREKCLRIDWKVRDMDRLEATKHTTHHSIKLSKDGMTVKHITTVGQPLDVTNDLAITSRAKGSHYMAVVRKGAKDPESGKTKQWLEIWDKTTKVKSIDLDSVEEHSTLILDPLLSNILWSPNGKQLLYVAEYKPPKPQSYYKKVNKTLENSGKELDSRDSRGQEFVYREDWGECFDGISHTVIGILDVDKDFKIQTIEKSGYSLGQPFWIGNGDQIGFVGWAEEPRRLGITYCPNRLSFIFTMNLKTEDSVPQLICGTENSSIRNPRPLTDGTGFVYLENKSGSTHRQASRLLRYSFELKTSEILIDTNGVREIIDTESGLKYGKISALFVEEITENCFTSDGKFLILNCFTELQLVLCLFDLKTKQLIPIEFPLPSLQLLDLNDNVLIAVGSALNTKPNIFVGKLNYSDNTKPLVEWKEMETNSSDLLNDISVDNFYIPSEDPNKLLTAILVSPKAVESQPTATVIMPHGGPHSRYANTYMINPSLLAKIGLKTLLVNYRGSIGVDEDYVNDLIGHVGDNDVRDVVHCIKYLSDKSLIDSSKLVLWGGSHGGFLVTHLSGQYAHMDFKACVAHNPVVDISSKFDGTDIPDWGYVEAFGNVKPFSFDTPLDPNLLRVMFEKSPINWISKVKVPTLMMLGKRDRRVSWTQGLKYYRILKARGVKTRCHVYDDNHGLQKVDVNGDYCVNICLWILENLS
ncbi:unnamed protein product, partial [Medioppia subpectinata]